MTEVSPHDSTEFVPTEDNLVAMLVSDVDDAIRWVVPPVNETMAAIYRATWLACAYAADDEGGHHIFANEDAGFDLAMAEDPGLIDTDGLTELLGQIVARDEDGFTSGDMAYRVDVNETRDDTHKDGFGWWVPTSETHIFFGPFDTYEAAVQGRASATHESADAMRYTS